MPLDQTVTVLNISDLSDIKDTLVVGDAGSAIEQIDLCRGGGDGNSDGDSNRDRLVGGGQSLFREAAGNPGSRYIKANIYGFGKGGVGVEQIGGVRDFIDAGLVQGEGTLARRVCNGGAMDKGVVGKGNGGGVRRGLRCVVGGNQQISGRRKPGRAV